MTNVNTSLNSVLIIDHNVYVELLLLYYEAYSYYSHAKKNPAMFTFNSTHKAILIYGHKRTQISRQANQV